MGIDLSDRNTRALAACIVASLALHAAVLLLFPGLREGRPAAAPSKVLSARIAPKSEFPERPEIKPEIPPIPPPPPPKRPPPPPPQRLPPPPAKRTPPPKKSGGRR
jgi:hypothetical protein